MLCSVGEEADVTVETHLAVDDAVVGRLVNHLAAGRVDGVYETILQLGELFLCLLLIPAIIDVAHRAILRLVFKNYPIPHFTQPNLLSSFKALPQSFG